MSSPSYNDSNVPFATGGVLCVINSGSYVLEDFTITRPSKTIERPDEIGGPNGFVVVKGQPSCTGVLQIATSSTARPLLGQTFTSTWTQSGTEVWAINSVSEPYRIGDYYKVTISALQTKATIS